MVGKYSLDSLLAIDSRNDLSHWRLLDPYVLAVRSMSCGITVTFERPI